MMESCHAVHMRHPKDMLEVSFMLGESADGASNHSDQAGEARRE